MTIIQKIEKWPLLEESALQQKARTKWIKLGDCNTKDFAAVSKKRTKKRIDTLTTLYGQKLIEKKEIMEEVVQFYKGLIGTATSRLLAVNKVVMQKRPVLTHQQKLFVNIHVTSDEVLASLKAIEDDKAPSIDGYNAGFSRKLGG
ncbi:hypothetical protein P3S67_000730 [Capsicum chacoense]